MCIQVHVCECMQMGWVFTFIKNSSFKIIIAREFLRYVILDVFS